MMNKLLTVVILLLVFGCKTPEARRPVSVKTGSFIDASIERNKKLNADEKVFIENLMKEKNVEYIASESGFWYTYNTKIESDTLQPQFGDVVNFNYNVSTINGTEIYSQTDLGSKTYVMDKEELFTGLREGLKLMKPAETVTFIFPSQKAFGYYGDDDKIGTNIPLICKVTLNTITQKND